jgi:hypothetical protein
MPPDGRVISFEVIDEVREFQDKTRTKVLLMQLVRLDDGKKEIRVGYYIIGKLPRMKDRWVWGQYAAFIPLPVFRRLLRKAFAKGWFGGSIASQDKSPQRRSGVNSKIAPLEARRGA